MDCAEGVKLKLCSGRFACKAAADAFCHQRPLCSQQGMLCSQQPAYGMLAEAWRSCLADTLHRLLDPLHLRLAWCEFPM